MPAALHAEYCSFDQQTQMEPLARQVPAGIKFPPGYRAYLPRDSPQPAVVYNVHAVRRLAHATTLPALHRVSQSAFSPVECRRRESLFCDARRPASCRPWRRAARVAHATNITATLWTHVGKSETIYKRVMHMIGAKSRACRSPRSTPLPWFNFIIITLPELWATA